MTIIHTKRNTVYAYEPQPDDVLVQAGWGAPNDDGTCRRLLLPYQPITEYQATVDWAVSVADQFAHPIHVVALNHRDIFNTNRFAPFRDLLANLTDQERGQVRQMCIASLAQVMRDCGVPALRAECYDLLVKFKAVIP